jgi:hypothetical protein
MNHIASRWFGAVLLAGTMAQWGATPAQAAPGLKVRRFSQDLAASSTLSVTNDCGKGWVPLIGMFSFDSTDGTAEGVDVEESAPVFTPGGPPTAWTTVIENAAPETRAVSWSILCEQASSTLYSVVSRARTVQGYSEAKLTVSCPAGSLAVSGGFDLSAVDTSEQVDVTSSAPWPSLGTLQGWRASFANEGGLSVQATVFAVCQVSPVPTLKLAISRVTIPPASTVAATAIGPGGRVAIGGGFQFITAGGIYEQTDVIGSGAIAGITGWQGSFKDNDPSIGGYTGTAYADCR